MSEMVERVARAIRAKVNGLPDDGSPIVGDGEDGFGSYMEIAAAAIAAMRVPTIEMLQASTHENGYVTEEAWEAMIDATLKA
jgi:hypothetical protein